MLFALAAPSLSATGCLSGSCNCPYGGGFTRVTVPAAKSSPIATVSASAPCMASAGTSYVDVTSNSAAGCQVLVQLQNGDTYALSVEFKAVTFSGDCGCGGFQVVNTPTPALTDAGID